MASSPRLAAIEEVLHDAGDLFYDPGDPLGLETSLRQSATLPLDSLRLRTEQVCNELAWDGVAQLTLDAYRSAGQTG